jgi:hypothetical protein
MGRLSLVGTECGSNGWHRWPERTSTGRCCQGVTESHCQRKVAHEIRGELYLPSLARAGQLRQDHDPALFTRMCNGPSHPSTNSVTDVWSARSSCHTVTALLPVDSVIPGATRSAASGRRTASTTRGPNGSQRPCRLDPDTRSRASDNAPFAGQVDVTRTSSESMRTRTASSASRQSPAAFYHARAPTIRFNEHLWPELPGWVSVGQRWVKSGLRSAWRLASPPPSIPGREFPSTPHERTNERTKVLERSTINLLLARGPVTSRAKCRSATRSGLIARASSSPSSRGSMGRTADEQMPNQQSENQNAENHQRVDREA